MRRLELASAVAAAMPADSQVVCGLGATSRAWREFGDERPSYYASDPMGMASSIALGLALADPDRPTTLLQGDGDLLMSLGALVTIGTAAPANLRVVVFNNGIYETGGKRPLPTGDSFEFGSIARGAGFGTVETPADDAAVAAALGRVFSTAGPGLAVVPVDQEDSPYGAPPTWSQAEERAFFLKAREAGR